MPHTGKPLPKPLIIVVFAILGVTILIFSILAYNIYAKSLYLSTTPVTLTNHGIELGKIYAAKVPRDESEKPAKGPPKKRDPLKNMTCRLQLPNGFAEPVYFTPEEEKEQYVLHAFQTTAASPSPGQPPATFLVSQIDMAPLEFQAYSRSLRLGALLDIKNSKILEEGPTTINGAPAYTLIIEGQDDHGNPVKSRQILIQGPSSIVYTIKATAPTSDWPAAGQNFDAAILTFKIPTPAASPTPTTTPSTSPAAPSDP